MNNNTTDEAAGKTKRGNPQYDPIHKSRPFIDSLMPRFREAYAPNRQTAIDEQVLYFN
jgi:hypothetical protein